MGKTENIIAALVTASCLAMPQTAAADGFKYYDVDVGTTTTAIGDASYGELSAAYELGHWTFSGEVFYTTGFGSRLRSYEAGVKYQFDNGIYATANSYTRGATLLETLTVGYDGEKLFGFAGMTFQSGISGEILQLGYEFDGPAGGSTEASVVYFAQIDGGSGWLGNVKSDFGKVGVDVQHINTFGRSTTVADIYYDATDRLTVKANAVVSGGSTFYGAGASYRINESLSVNATVTDIAGTTYYGFGIGLDFQEKSLRDFTMADLYGVQTSWGLPRYQY